MSFDLIVLVLTTIALMKSPNRSSLWQLLFGQGLIYFLVAFIFNTIPAIFLVLNLNSTYFFNFSQPFMNNGAPSTLMYTYIVMVDTMFTMPAVVASSIVACRSFISLANFLHKDVYVYSP